MKDDKSSSYQSIIYITSFEYLDICLATLMNLLDIFSIEDEPIVNMDDVTMIISPIVNMDDVSMIIAPIVDIDDVSMIISPIVNMDDVNMIIAPIVNMDDVSMIIPPIVITIIVIVELQSDTHKYAS